MFSVFHNFWFIQTVGVIGLIFSILSWNSSTRKKILQLQCWNSLAFLVHYFLLGALAGALMNILVLGRNFVFMKKGERTWADHIAWFYIFSLLSVVGVLLSWKGFITILPAIGIIIGTYAIYQNSPAKIRLFILIACLVWVPYTLVVKSYAGFVSQIVAIVGIIIGIYRLDRKETQLI